MKILHKRYKIAPQMENYDNLSCTYRPYMMFFNKENFKSKNVNTDENGFRVNFIDKKYNSNLIQLKKIEENTAFEKNLVAFPLGFIGPDIDDKTIKVESNWLKVWMRIVDHSASNLPRLISGVLYIVIIFTSIVISFETFIIVFSIFPMKPTLSPS